MKTTLKIIGVVIGVVCGVTLFYTFILLWIKFIMEPIIDHIMKM